MIEVHYASLTSQGVQHLVAPFDNLHGKQSSESSDNMQSLIPMFAMVCGLIGPLKRGVIGRPSIKP